MLNKIFCYKLAIISMIVTLLYGCVSTHIQYNPNSVSKMIIVGFNGVSVEDIGVTELKRAIDDKKIGGVLFLKKNIKSREQISSVIKYLSDNYTRNLFFAVDQEGGNIQRCHSGNGCSDYPSAFDIAVNKCDNSSFEIYQKMACELKEIGFNLNFAPVLDLNINADSPAIGKLKRSYSDNVTIVVDCAETLIDAHHKCGMFTAAKHFPGHGSASNDSHLGFTDVTNSWSENELLPYFYLKGQYDMVMMSHVYNSRLDSDFPASMSKKIISMLKRDIVYDGLIISDDMQMGAVASIYPLKDAIVNAVNAGNDILIFSGYFDPDPLLGYKIYDIISDAVKEGLISQERIIESSIKIDKLFMERR